MAKCTNKQKTASHLRVAAVLGTAGFDLNTTKIYILGRNDGDSGDMSLYI